MEYVARYYSVPNLEQIPESVNEWDHSTGAYPVLLNLATGRFTTFDMQGNRLDGMSWTPGT